MSVPEILVGSYGPIRDKKPIILSSLSIIIPAYNEEESLEEVVRDSLKVGAEISKKLEVVVINDGSTDNTGKIADRLAAEHRNIRVIHHPHNRGFGSTQQTGFANARYEYLTLVPADKQFDVRCLKKFTYLIPECDVVAGYRVKRKDRPHRKLNTKVFRMVMRLVFGVNLRDINWVKLFRREVFDSMNITFDGIGVDAEVMVKAQRRGFRFREVWVSYLPRTTGQSTGDAPSRVIKTLIELMVLWLRLQFFPKHI
ncbi:MAG: glycosyltransferase family 2 protein [Planctomycetes bacterium]|nr:glycosyltransferase family 2 protein [Planctomycetota bacterium]